MAKSSYHKPPESLAKILGDDGYRYFLQVHRHVYGVNHNTEGTLDGQNVVDIESLSTSEDDASLVLRPTGDGETVEWASPPGIDATYLTLSTNADLPNERVATAGTNITITDAGAGSTATFAVSPQGAGSGLDADKLDARQATEFVWSLAKLASTPLTGAVTLSQGTNVTLSQVGQNIAISASGSGGTGTPSFAFFMS